MSRGGERGLGACAGGAGISDTDLVRSWVPGGAKAPGRGGDPVRPEPKEKEGREPDATVLSARDLSCSDQLKPWSVRVADIKSEVALGRVREVVERTESAILEMLFELLGCAWVWVVVEERASQDVAVAETDWGGAGSTASVVIRRRSGQIAESVTENWAVCVPLAVPGLPPPGRRIAAAAPKLMRRLKGVGGTVRAEVGESSSSMAFSSKSELVDVLARRARLEAAGGKAPAIPRVVVVVRDSLRRCSLMAAVVTALGKTGVPEIELLRWKS